MMDTEHATPGTSPGHEKTDVEVRPIASFLVGLFLLIFVAMAGMTFLFNFLADHFRRGEGQPSPLVDTRQIPPGPRLQANPAEDLAAVQDWEKKQLGTYEWIDRETGVFRIPIDRAIDLVAQTGLPARNTAPRR